MKYCWGAAVLFFAAALSFFSCSLKYDDAVDAEKNTPEFIFNEAKLVRYKDGNEEVRVQAQNIEQYKNSSITYGKNVKFMTYDKDHKLETEGSCGYLFADTDSELYELYDGIKLFSSVQNTNFFADMLRWNGKTEQLTGGRRDTVRIEKDGTIIYGTGFSASGVSKKFSFAGTVSGEIEAKDKEAGSDTQSENEQEEQRD
ncbi:MAG: LPS export ABC transporter periplasmic protein LptC [Treponema sp.]|nr:LPS export ABC transporter periplasmic protein LptC [Treponema sp.]